MRTAVRLAQGLYHHEDIFPAARAMAFHVFLSLLPLLAFTGYVLGLVAQRKGASAAIGLVVENLPATTRAMIEGEVTSLASADRLGPLAAAGFLWIAAGGIQGLMQAIERVVGAPRRPWWKQRLLALAWVIATLAAFGVASFALIEWDAVIHAQPARRILRIGGERVIAVGLSITTAVGVLAAFYRFAVARPDGVRRRVVPGALLAIALILLISSAFGLYVGTLGGYAVYYGGLAAIAVLLVWLWLVSLSILVGAELNAQLEGLRD